MCKCKASADGRLLEIAICGHESVNVMFAADISKTLTAKRQRLEQYTQNSLRTSNRKVEEIWTMQQNER